MPCKVKHPAIYQHWLSKSGSLPISSLTAVILSFLCFFFFIWERVAYSTISHTVWSQLSAAFGMKSWGLKCSAHGKSLVQVTYSHSVDHSLWLRLLWAVKCSQSDSDKLAANYKPHTKTFQTISISPLVKISICMQILLIATRKLSHPLSNSQWTFKDYYTG